MKFIENVNYELAEFGGSVMVVGKTVQTLGE